MNKRITISLAVILLLAGGVAFAMWQSDATKNGDDTDITQEDPDEPINEADERNRNEENSQNNASTQQNDTGNGTNSSGNGDDRENIPPTMTNWNWDSDNQMATVRAHVDGATSGTCTVVFEKSGYSPVTQQAPIGLQGATYVCQGFNVERSEFPATGEWSVRVEFSSDTASGASQTQTIRIQ